jgi:hypothetical protein
MPQCFRAPRWIRYDGAKSARIGKLPGTGSRNVVIVDASPPGQISGQLGEQPRETGEMLSRLPTDPHKLLRRVSTDPFFEETLRKGPATTPGAQFSRILNILQVAPGIPPRVDAALYRALKLIPGTRLVGTPMKDALGRPGLAIGFAFHDGDINTRDYLILDPETYAYRGYRRDWHGAHDFTDLFARGVTGIVDHPGQVPGGSAPDPSDVVNRPVLRTPGFVWRRLIDWG